MKFKILILISIPAFMIVSSIIIKTKTNRPPEVEMKEAREMLTEAQFEKSPGFAKETFQEAKLYYDSAMVEWKKQNDKFILFRNYKKVAELAKKSTENSKRAVNRARKNISSTEDMLETRIEKLGERIKNFEDDFGSFPMTKNHRDEITQCKMIYSESLHAYKNKNYSICKSKLDSVEIIINGVLNHYQDRLFAYFNDYPKWNEMVEKTINHSKKNKLYVVVVDKLARKLFIYKNGEIYKQFTIELGTNWVGDKQQQGDKSTPEGLYKIIDKKQNGQTKYYKAFLLNYPNEDDKKRFSLNKKNGIIKPNAKIGNLIEIHGNGGKGIDWTDGCIALTDTEMDKIFKLCPIGTEVTIVGSTKPLNKLSFNQK